MTIAGDMSAVVVVTTSCRPLHQPHLSVIQALTLPSPLCLLEHYHETPHSPPAVSDDGCNGTERNRRRGSQEMGRLLRRRTEPDQEGQPHVFVFARGQWH